MKNIFVIALIAVVVTAVLFGTAMASMQTGPAPNSGDGVSDGSGLNSPTQNGDLAGDNIPWVPSEGPGAPNAGDGVSDGSGW